MARMHSGTAVLFSISLEYKTFSFSLHCSATAAQTVGVRSPAIRPSLLASEPGSSTSLADGRAYLFRVRLLGGAFVRRLEAKPYK